MGTGVPGAVAKNLQATDLPQGDMNLYVYLALSFVAVLGYWFVLVPGGRLLLQTAVLDVPITAVCEVRKALPEFLPAVRWLSGVHAETQCKFHVVIGVLFPIACAMGFVAMVSIFGVAYPSDQEFRDFGSPKDAKSKNSKAILTCLAVVVALELIAVVVTVWPAGFLGRMSSRHVQVSGNYPHAAFFTPLIPMPRIGSLWFLLRIGMFMFFHLRIDMLASKQSDGRNRDSR